MEDKKNSFRFVWGILMVVAYLGIAYLVVFTPVLIRYNDANNDSSNDENLIARLVLGVVLLIYGLFRGYRMWKVTR